MFVKFENKKSCGTVGGQNPAPVYTIYKLTYNIDNILYKMIYYVILNVKYKKYII